MADAQKNKKNRKSKRPISDNIHVEPLYNPDAVSFYYESSSGVGSKPSKGNTKVLIENAKMHLRAIGWTFYDIWKSTNTKELRYRSPTGKSYNSLRTACFACLSDSQQLNHGLGSGSRGSVDFDDRVVQQRQLPPPPLNASKITTVGNYNGFAQQSQLPSPPVNSSGNVVGNCNGFAQQSQLPPPPPVNSSGNVVDNYYGFMKQSQLPPPMTPKVTAGNCNGFAQQSQLRPPPPVNPSGNVVSNCNGFAKQSQLPPPLNPSKITVANCSGFVQQSQLPPLVNPSSNVFDNCSGFAAWCQLRSPVNPTDTAVSNCYGFAKQSRLLPPVNPTDKLADNCNGFVQQSELPPVDPTEHVVGNCYEIVQETPITKNHTIINSYDGNLNGFDDFSMNLDSTSFEGLVLKENQLPVNPNLDYSYNDVFFDPLPQEIDGWFVPKKFPQEIIRAVQRTHSQEIVGAVPEELPGWSVPKRLPQEINGAVPEKLCQQINGSGPKKQGQGKRGRKKEKKVVLKSPRKRAKAVARHIGGSQRDLRKFVAMVESYKTCGGRDPNVVCFLHEFLRCQIQVAAVFSTKQLLQS